MPSRRLDALVVVSFMVAHCLVVVGCAPAPKSSATATSPDVFVLLVDCLRADHLCSYGYELPTSPHIDALAADSILFRNAISQSTFTKSSIASLFTAQYPHRHGVYTGHGESRDGEIESDVLPESATTIAELLAADGYFTVGLLEQAHLRGYMGFGQGFAEYDASSGGIPDIHEKLMTWLPPGERGRPLFAYLHYIDLHDPYRPPPPYDELYGTYSDVYRNLDSATWGEELARIQSSERKLSTADVAQLRASYDGLITYIDDEIGEFLDILRWSGQYDDALIILTSDHGDGFMEHGSISHGGDGYDEIVRVPLIVKLPGQKHAGRVVEEQVRLVDVAPTILDIIDSVGELPEPDGRSMLPLIEGRSPRDWPRWAVSETAFSEGKLIPHIAIRSREFKYIYRETAGHDELYDLRVDPGETTNIRAQRSDLVAELRARAELMVAAYQERQEIRVAVESGEVDELRALGYLQ